MALLQISEPGQSTSPHEHRLAAGIDLGTTNSLVASVRSGVADTLDDAEGMDILPSVVRYTDHGEVMVGAKALGYATQDPLNTLASVKRMMGRSASDLATLEGHLPYRFADQDSGVPQILTAAGPVTSMEVSAEILKTLRARAEDCLGGELAGAVITVPAYFDDAQRQATKDAARLAGLNVFRLLNEPTAAAVAYGLDRQAQGVTVVYDLGGGTFDVSVLALTRGVFEVLATGGDTALGGDDFDRQVAAWVLDQTGLDVQDDPQLLRKILAEARKAKEVLSLGSETVIRLEHGTEIREEIRLTREDFEHLIAPYVRKTIAWCRKTLREAEVEPSKVEHIILVGGSTRIPHVRREVQEFFGRPPLSGIDPDKVVAIGAAQQADVLAGNVSGESVLLLDVLPLSLGVETMGNLVSRIIERNTPIPVSRAQEFTTFKDGQTAMRIHVLQGEREKVGDCRSLATFDLTGIPPMVAGAAHIKVTFQVDADGLLSVRAQEKTSSVSASVEVKPSYGLTDTEIETMLRDSFEHAEQDMHAKNLAERQVEARRVLEALRAALEKDGQALLSGDERESIMRAQSELEAVSEADDPERIKQAIGSLERASETFVARRMNQSVRRVMRGHRVEEFE